jgi:putative tryptophan/tyrosine transport system permease protein
VALAGSIMAQSQGFSDVGMGTGIIVMGLASIIMGEAIFKKVSFIKITSVALIGSILYKTAMALALELNFPPTDLKLITAVIVVIALSLNNKSFKFNLFKKPALNTIGGGYPDSDTKPV